jgi:hypothetical protein
MIEDKMAGESERFDIILSLIILSKMELTADTTKAGMSNR